MSDLKTTYVAFGAAIASVLALGLFQGGPQNAAGTKSTTAEPALPGMAEVVTAPKATPMDQSALRAEIRSYLMDEPEVIMEAVRLLEERRVVDEAQADIELVKTNAEAIFNDGYSFVGGNPEGSITVVEFQDYRCGYCKRAHGEVQELIKEDGDIRLVVKEFPILGPDSTLTSELAIATLITQGDDAYKRISDAFMTYGGPVNDEAIARLARGALVDIEQSRAALEDPEIKRRIEDTRNLGRKMRISGTPTFIIGEKIIRGYVPKAQMAEVVDLSRRVSQ